MARIEIDIVTNASRAAREVDQTASSFDKFKGGLGQLAVPAAAAATAIGAFGYAAAQSASTLQQATGGVQAVFKTSAGTINAWAATADQSAGLAESAYKTMAAGIGGALTGMGVPLTAAADQTGALITRAADLASVYGGTTADATEAVTAAFRGEYDSLQRLIPSISDAAVKQEMAAEAAAGQTFATEDAAKASAIYNTIMNKSADAAGNFAAESDTAEGAAQRSAAAYENAKAKLGEQLLPALTAVNTALGTFAQWVSENSTLVTVIVGVVGGFALVILALNAALSAATAIQTAWATAQTIGTAISGGLTAATSALATAMAAVSWPVLAVVAAIAAVIAITVLLIKNWDTVVEVAGKCWDAVAAAARVALEWIKSAAAAVVDFLKSAWSGLGDFLSGVWDKIKSAAAIVWEAVKIIALAPILALKAAWDTWGSGVIAIWEKIKSVGVAIWGAIKSAATTALDAIMVPINAVKNGITWVIDKIKSAIGFAQTLASKIPFIGGFFSASSAAPAAGLAGRYWVAAHGAPSVAGRGRLAAPSVAGVGGGVNITVTGALDPVAVARQIRALLVAQDRRTGGTRT